MGKSYTNAIRKVEVELAVEQLLVAPEGTAWAPGRVDVAAPPSGFNSLGAVVEDTPTVQGTREKFTLETGLPKTIQFESIQSIGGSFQCRLHSNSWRKAQYALGNYEPEFSNLTEDADFTAGSGRTATVAADAPAVGDQVILAADQASAILVDAVETVVTKVDGTTITFNEDVPDATGKIFTYDYVRQVWGGSKTREFALLGVADFANNVQVVHYFPKVTAADEFNEEFRPDANGQIPLNFSAQGVTATVDGSSELVVFERFYFPGTGS